jgi:riboflavin kinase / FMN adenylyltransferase
MLAKQSGGESLVITYWPHPRLVVGDPGQVTKLLSTLDEKIELLRKCGVDSMLILPFTREFSQTTSMDFIQKVLVETINISTFVIGYDHTFGKDREGNYDQLQEESEKYGFTVEQFEKFEVFDSTPSSGVIRRAVMEGDMDTAFQFLGRNYSFYGILEESLVPRNHNGSYNFAVRLKDTIKLLPTSGTFKVQVNKAQHTETLTIQELSEGSVMTLEVQDFGNYCMGDTVQISFLGNVV